MKRSRLPLFRRLRRWGALAAGAALLGACKPGVPGRILSEQVMEDVLYDYHLAQAMAEGTDSMEQQRYLYVQSVFRKHRITEAQFDSSMVWYSSHATYLNDIYRRLGDRFDAEARVLGIGTGPVDVYAGLTNRGDTANIWAEKSFYLLKPGEGGNRMTFVMEADTTFYPGDSFLWRFDTRFIYQEGQREAYASLSVRLSNDSVVGILHRLTSDGKAEISVRPRGDWEVKEVTGFVYVPLTEPKSTYRMLVIDRPALIRFHKKRKAAADTAAVVSDSLRTDSACHKTVADSLPALTPRMDRRLTPRELREETQSAERTIKVVKSRPYQPLPARPGRTRRQR